MSQIQQVKEATDIVQLIGERLSLQRSGTNWRGLCPFHGEKSPSFFVNEQFQRYKCFGCGESGDVFNFLEKYEGMTFGEALKFLADRAHIELVNFTPDPSETERQRLLGVLDLAKDYYHYLLVEHKAGAPARAYLKDRGITKESIKLFRIGYALPSWDGLIQYLHGKKKYDLADLVAAGLVVNGRGGRNYDRFRDRLMFPLANHRGQVVGFSGRLLSVQAKEAKYINTPETLLYHKSQMLFGLSELYQAIRTEREVVVVEGEFDVISSTQAHVNNVVAIKGSALTADHAKLLSRVADRVLLSLDMDSAGVEATKRAISVVKGTNLELRVVRLPSGKDPDELAKNDPAGWRQAVKSSASVYDFFLHAALQQHDANKPEGKRHILQELAPILAEIPLVVEQEVYIRKLAEALGTTTAAVMTDIKQVVAQRAARQTLQKSGVASGSMPAESARQDQPEGTPETKEPISNLEEYVLFLLLRSTPQQLKDRASQLEATWFHLPAARQFITVAQKAAAGQPVTSLIKGLASDLQEALFEIYLNPRLTVLLEQIEVAKEWPARVGVLKLQAVQDELEALTKKLRELETNLVADPDRQAEYDQVLARVAQIQKQLRTGA